jgi:surface protein
MSTRYASTSNIVSKDTPPPRVPALINNDSSLWVRPSDWLTLPTVTSTDQKFVGLLAVFNDTSNYTALMATVPATVGSIASCRIGDGSTSGGGVSGNVFMPGGTLGLSLASLAVGQVLTGTGVSANTSISTRSTCAFTATTSTTTMTVTAISSGTITIGMTLTYGATLQGTAWVTAFGTGSGGVGTYTISSSVIQTPTGGLYLTVNNSQLVAATTFTITNTYQVDWGDGSSPQIYNSGVQANYLYDYATISNSTISTLGYKQVIVTVTPVSGNLTTFDLQQRYLNTAIAPGTMPNPMPGKWLDITIGSPFMSSPMFITANQTGPNTLVAMNMLEQVSVMSVASTYNTSYQFYNGYALRSVPTFPMQFITGLAFWFQNCTKLTHIPACMNSGSNNTSLNTTFQSCFALSNVANLETSINTSKVNSLSDTFNSCYSLKSIPFFNTSNVTNTGRMFAGCTGLYNVANLDLGNVTSVNLMFNNTTQLETIPNFNLGKVIQADNMFNGALNLKNIPPLNLSNATTTISMFQSCRNLVSIPKLSIPKVTDATSMFSGCFRLETIEGGIVNTSNLVNMTSMFTNCTSLIDMPLISDTSKVTSMASTFQGCSSMSNFANLTNTSNVTNTASMFNSCFSMQTAPTITMTKVTNASAMFQSCRSLTTVPTYDTGNVLDASSMFNSCTSLSTVPLLNTIKVTSTASMFNSCASINSVPAFNTSNVTTLSNMFNTASNLKTIPNFDFNKVTNFTGFSQSSGITIIPAFNLANAVTIGTGFVSNNTSQFLGSNIKVAMSIAGSNYSKTALENLFTNGLFGQAASPILTITGNPGADTAVTTPATCNFSQGGLVITLTSGTTTGLSTGMFSISSIDWMQCTVTITVSGNYLSTSLLNNFQEDQIVSLASNVGNLTLATYYRITNIGIAGSNTFRLKDYNTGALITVNTNGSSTMYFMNDITALSSNTITMRYRVFGNGSGQALTFRRLNTRLASLKNWVITG